MRNKGYTPRRDYLSSPLKRGVFPLPFLFVLNTFVFSSWPQLGQALSNPWLPLAWLYGLAALAPLAWRDRAPLAVFFIESALTVAAWPFMDLYIPVVGVPVALYSVTLNRSPRLALASLLVSFCPVALGAASTLRAPHLPESQRAQIFVSTLVVLVMAAIGAVVLGNVSRGIRRQVQQLQRAREATREVGLLSSERRRVAGVLVGVHQLTTVIVVQVTRATHLADTDAIQVAQALKHIGATAQQALSELRRLFEAVEVNQSTRDTVGSGTPPGTPDRRT